MKTAIRRVSFITATTLTLLSMPWCADLGGQAGSGFAAPAKAAARGESLEAWTDRITKQVKQNWHPPQCNVSENTVMYCDIDATGKIVGTKLQKSSGVKALDDSVSKAFTDTTQVAPPPVAFPKGVPAITVEITFDYKVQQQQAAKATPAASVPRAAKPALAAPAVAAPAVAAPAPALDTTSATPASTVETSAPALEATPAAEIPAAEIPAAEIPAASPPMEMPPATPAAEETSTPAPSASPPAGAADGDPFEAK